MPRGRCCMWQCGRGCHMVRMTKQAAWQNSECMALNEWLVEMPVCQ